MKLARAAIFLVLGLPLTAAAQTPGDPNGSHDALRVFLDCHSCDFDYLRREVPFVNYVRDRTEAEVHVLVTTQGTGGGGTEYTFTFIGLERFQGVDDTLTYTAAQTDTSDERRAGYARVFALGLVRYASSTSLAERLQLVYRAPEGQATATPETDPWNFWVFRVRGSGSVDGEQSNKSRRLSASLSANRTTDQWKIAISTNLNFRTNQYTLSEGEILDDTSHDHSGNAQVVKSLGEHWSVMGRTRVSSTTFLNEDLWVRGAGGVEYDVFPYAESSRRELTLQLTTGVNRFKYTETTLYGKDEETVVDGTIRGSFDVRQPWGTSGVSFEAATYFHDLGRHRMALSGDIDVRLFKGLSLTMDGSASRVNDQLYLQAGDATDEEILLRRRQLATSYRYRFSVGLSYTFGSIFNSVVNPRF